VDAAGIRNRRSGLGQKRCDLKAATRPFESYALLDDSEHIVNEGSADCLP